MSDYDHKYIARKLMCENTVESNEQRTFMNLGWVLLGRVEEVTTAVWTHFKWDTSSRMDCLQIPVDRQKVDIHKNVGFSFIGMTFSDVLCMPWLVMLRWYNHPTRANHCLRKYGSLLGVSTSTISCIICLIVGKIQRKKMKMKK